MAGSLYVVGCTAYAAVRAVDPGPDDTVAVSAAAGGVGSIVVQLLGCPGGTGAGHRLAGQRRVARRPTAPSPWPTATDWPDRLREAAGPRGIDAFIDLFGPEYVQLAVDLGIDPDRIETIISFEEAAEVGAQGGRQQHGVHRPRC